MHRFHRPRETAGDAARGCEDEGAQWEVEREDPLPVQDVALAGQEDRENIAPFLTSEPSPPSRRHLRKAPKTSTPQNAGGGGVIVGGLVHHHDEHRVGLRRATLTSVTCQVHDQSRTRQTACALALLVMF